MFANLTRGTLCVSLLVCCHLLATQAAESTCKAGDSCKGQFTSPYFWPMAHGHPNYYGNPPWPGPTDLQSSFKWRFNGPTGRLYEESFVTAVIDDKKNIYANGDKHVYKLSPDGQLLWTYSTRTAAAANGNALMDGVLYGDGAEGWVWAVDMETGKEKWAVKASSHNGGEYGHIAAHNGVVVTEGDKKEIPQGNMMAGNAACGTVRGLNGTDGKELWAFYPDGILWDWFPQFPDSDSVIFMEQTGKMYRLELKTGKVIWQAGGIPKSWTDGCQMVASNGLVYGVAIDPWSAPCPKKTWGMEECPGIVAAHKISDGSHVWTQKVPLPPNTAPVVGQINNKLTLVMPIGQQSGGCFMEVMLLWNWFPILHQLPWFMQTSIFWLGHQASVLLGDDYNWLLWGKADLTHSIKAFDAETADPLWTWQGPTNNFKVAPGDRDGYIPRNTDGHRSISCPTPWSSARIGSDGTIYIGNENGNFYAIRDANGDNHIDDEKEVSVYKTKGVFAHPGTAHAPGMVVAVNFDSVFVFKS